MKASSVLSFQQTATTNLRRPWQTFKDGQLWYGVMKSGSKRHPLTSKQGNKQYYKGTRSSGVGKLNNAGNYIVDWSKVRTYVTPSEMMLTGLKPLVSPNVPQTRQKYVGYSDGAKSPELAWKNIVDFIEYGEGYDDYDFESNQYLQEFINPELVKSELPEDIKQ